jgi:lipopolysaccharide export LptBFGC system permease protein LptF
MLTFSLRKLFITVILFISWEIHAQVALPTFQGVQSAGYKNTSSLTTTKAAGNGANGNVFQIKNVHSSTIEIYGFKQGATSSNSSNVMYAYYRNGTYNSGTSGWTQILSNETVPLVANTYSNAVDFDTAFEIPANTTYTLHLYSTSSMQYTNGSGTANSTVTASNDFLYIYEGGGSIIQVHTSSSSTPHVQSYIPRIWNGKIRYRY